MKRQLSDIWKTAATAAVFVSSLAAASAATGASLTQRISETQKVVRTDKWHGFDRTVFLFEGRTAWIVEPPCAAAPGAPWTWTMQWADAFVERTGVPDLLARGWRHATIDLFSTKMDGKGLETAAAYQKFLVEKLGFAPKANLVGMSWGGFFSIRYAATHPGNVRRIYLDAPLLSFDGFKAALPAAAAAGQIGSWKDSMPAKGAKWSDDPRMPVNMAKPVADAGIPVLLLFGGKDVVVPPAENALPFIEKFIAAGGTITVVPRPAYGHHPHGMDAGKTAAIAGFFAGDGAEAGRGVPDAPHECESGGSGGPALPAAKVGRGVPDAPHERESGGSGGPALPAAKVGRGVPDAPPAGRGVPDAAARPIMV